MCMSQNNCWYFCIRIGTQSTQNLLWFNLCTTIIGKEGIIVAITPKCPKTTTIIADIIPTYFISCVQVIIFKIVNIQSPCPINILIS